MSAEKAPAFQFYPKDFLSDVNVAMMSMEELGCYIKLLCVCWINQAVPAEPDRLATICGMDRERFAAAWPQLRHCFVETDGLLRHPRLDSERAKQDAYRQKRAVSGRVGGSARSRVNATTKHTPSTDQASAKQVLSNEEASAKQVLSKNQALLSPDYVKDPPYPPNGGKLVVVAQQAVADAEHDMATVDVLTDDAAAERARQFIEAYPAIYARAKHGATYRVKEARDFPAALDLVTNWPDLHHLTDMLRLFLMRKDFAPKNEPGSPRQFAFMAPQCDAMLREARRAS